MKSKEDFKKVNLKTARYGHISQDKITVCFNTRIQGASVEYSIDFENNGTIPIPLNESVRSYYVSEDLVKYLKDFTEISHYPNNSTDSAKKLGLSIDTVIARTKKGNFVNSRIIKADGYPMNCCDIEPVYKTGGLR